MTSRVTGIPQAVPEPGSTTLPLVPRRAAFLVLAACLVGVACRLRGDGAETGEATGTTTSPAGCRDVEAPAAREPDGGDAAHGAPRPRARTWTLTFDDVLRHASSSRSTSTRRRQTAASLVALAEDGFYDDTIFHRIVPGFVIQGGDPTQTGRGGPGYSTVDVPPADAAYMKGVVAMAKTAAEPPGTSGSQFFVVTGDDVGLPPEYAVVGKVTEGLDVVELIGTLGDPATEQPHAAGRRSRRSTASSG